MLCGSWVLLVADLNDSAARPRPISLDRRKIGRREENRFNAIADRERTARGFFGGGFRGDPYGIGAESGPRFSRGCAVRVGEKIDQGLAGAFVGVGGVIITEVSHPVFREERHRVVAEARIEGGDFSNGRRVSAQFEEPRRALVLGGDRRKIGSGQKNRFYLGDDFAADLAFRTHVFPLGICAEIFPLSGKDLGVTFSTAANWISNAIVSGSFLTLIHYLGSSNTFLLYAGFQAFSWLFFGLFVPETKGVSLEKIESNLFSGLPLRKIGS